MQQGKSNRLCIYLIKSTDYYTTSIVKCLKIAERHFQSNEQIALMTQKPLFTLYAAGIAGHGRCADDPMAGHHDPHRIGADWQRPPRARRGTTSASASWP